MFTSKAVTQETDCGQVVPFPEANRDHALHVHRLEFEGVLARVVNVMCNVTHATEEVVVEDSLEPKGTNCVNKRMWYLRVYISKEVDIYSQCCCSPVKR